KYVHLGSMPSNNTYRLRAACGLLPLNRLHLVVSEIGVGSRIPEPRFDVLLSAIGPEETPHLIRVDIRATRTDDEVSFITHVFRIEVSHLHHDGSLLLFGRLPRNRRKSPTFPLCSRALRRCLCTGLSLCNHLGELVVSF